MHHPPFVTGMGAMDEPFENVGRRRYPEPFAVGAPVLRAYRPIVTQWAGCIALTSPPCPCRSILDLSPEGGNTFRMETPAILLHHWDGSVLNSHICQIRVRPRSLALTPLSAP
ncbi:MAG: hypothetical protein ACLR7Z_21965 [Bilophila wadsworthia]